MSFESVGEFERQIAQYFGSPYAVAVDCCTHAVELCMRYQNVKHFSVPKRTYISIPFLGNKLNIDFDWRDEEWQDYYYIGDTNIIDAAVLWKEDSYISNTFMCLSFQYRKHLSLGRGGMILTDNKKAANDLKKMSYDGRIPNEPWREQDIATYGFHYYMTPDMGIKKLPSAISSAPKKWLVNDWPDLTTMDVFNK